MEMLRRNLKRQASRSLSALAVATSPRAAAADQENLHPNLASPPACTGKTSSAKDMSPRPKQNQVAAAPPAAAAAKDDHAAAPAVDEPSVKVTLTIRSTPLARGQFQIYLLAVGCELFEM
jgi:kinesin family member 15